MIAALHSLPHRWTYWQLSEFPTILSDLPAYSVWLPIPRSFADRSTILQTAWAYYRSNNWPTARTFADYWQLTLLHYRPHRYSRLLDTITYHALNRVDLSRLDLSIAWFISDHSIYWPLQLVSASLSTARPCCVHVLCYKTDKYYNNRSFHVTNRDLSTAISIAP